MAEIRQTKMTKYNHSDLVEIAEKWLLKRCGFAFKELSTSAGETPDGIGFRSDSSILVECKATRDDFRSDKKKTFRRNPWMGVGQFRYYMCPKGLISPGELPDKWGLLYVDKKGAVRKKVGPIGNVFSSNNYEWAFERDIQKEMSLMYSALRRLQIQGVMPLIYERYRK